MMKVALACTFLLALTYSVSAEKINCYNCIEGDVPASLKGKSLASLFGSRADIPPVPTVKCAENVENSTTVEVDNEQMRCIKVDIEVSSGDKSQSVTMRGASVKDICPAIEDEFQKLIDQANDAASQLGAEEVDGDIECNECDEDKCNLASTVQASFLMILAPALAYLMRS